MPDLVFSNISFQSVSQHKGVQIFALVIPGSINITLKSFQKPIPPTNIARYIANNFRGTTIGYLYYKCI